jgi:hypothetical protein
MSEKLIQSQQRLRESLYDLYEIGGSELFQAGTRGLKRDLIRAGSRSDKRRARTAPNDQRNDPMNRPPLKYN